MPLTISLTFPAGRYVAASWDDKEKAEWPPHPARLCLALIDTLHRTGNRPSDRAALQWLCKQNAPSSITLPCESFVSIRKMDGFFVPQNPSAAKNIKHTRKARSFPSVFLDPDQPTVFFHWEKADLPDEHRTPLAVLLSGIPRFGHSSSLVIASLAETTPSHSEDWRIIQAISSEQPVTPDVALRVPWPGLLESAEDAFDEKNRTEEMAALIKKNTTARKDGSLPKPAASPRGRHDPRHQWQGYAVQSLTDIPGTPWSPEILILFMTGDRLGLQSTLQLTEVFHKTILDHWHRHPEFDQIPAWISGHTEGSYGEKTAATKTCHLASFPLPFVDHVHADGHLLGLAIALPKPETIGITRGEVIGTWRKALQAMATENGTIALTPPDKSWQIELTPETSPKPRQALSSSRWTHSSTTWTTVTPIILDRHPKPHFKKDPVAWQESCRKIIQQACENLGLPTPNHIAPSPYSPLKGVPPAPAMPTPKRREGRPARFHVHATITFPEKITGPLLIGAGRFRGYGLCLPYPSNQ